MPDRDSWGEPPAAAGSSHATVHVWRAGLDLPPADLTALLPTLSQDERARANAFRSSPARARFVAARGLLRRILVRYLGGHPGDLRFSYGVRGKPALAHDAGARSLRFSVAHSRGLALYAISWGREIGVDLECVDPAVDSAMAERLFSPLEIAALRALPPGHRAAGFYACWTRKEAYLKARGDGFAVDPDRFGVSVAPDGTPALLFDRDTPDGGARWSLAALHVFPGYAAALCVEGRGWTLNCWQWPGPGPSGMTRA